MSEEVLVAPHGVMEGFYDNLRNEVVLHCLCGYEARGNCWEWAGRELDVHLEENPETGS